MKNSARKRLLSMLPLSILMAGSMPVAHAEIESQLALTSNYVQRGITLSGRGPALQFGIKERHSGGVYHGLWASTLKLNDGGPYRVEGEYLLGLASSSVNWQWDAGMTVMGYPASSQPFKYGTFRYHADLRYLLPMESFGFYADYVQNYFEAGPAYYAEAYALFPLSDGIGAEFHWGRQRYSDPIVSGTRGYTYSQVALNKKAGPWQASFSYHVTGLPGATCFGGKRWCGEMAVFTVKRDFSL